MYFIIRSYAMDRCGVFFFFLKFFLLFIYLMICPSPGFDPVCWSKLHCMKQWSISLKRNIHRGVMCELRTQSALCNYVGQYKRWFPPLPGNLWEAARCERVRLPVKDPRREAGFTHDFRLDDDLQRAGLHLRLHRRTSGRVPLQDMRKVSNCKSRGLF